MVKYRMRLNSVIKIYGDVMNGNENSNVKMMTRMLLLLLVGHLVSRPQ